jgi:acetyl-CoA C-acetyltransferase
MCGSGMKAAMLAYDQVAAGSAGIVVAGGMESMTNAPYLLEKARAGYRLGHGKVIDHMFLDGLEDAYDKGRLMGTFAEDTAQHYQFTRQAQDDYAIASLNRALKAIADGKFREEIVPVGDVVDDEQPAKAKPDKIPQLKPAFRDGGTVTAANSSSISDGGAALIVTRMSTAEKTGVRPLAVIKGHASFAQAQPGSPLPRCSPCRSCWTSSTGRLATLISTRSTRLSPWSPWRRCASWTCRTTRSM